ncbi:MAG: hypothetical protein V4772_00650 [Pseudomonadota bacterium]
MNLKACAPMRFRIWPALRSSIFGTSVLLLSVLLNTSALATTKDIVLDRLNHAAQPASVPAVSDAMAVSVLVESADGSLTPRSTQNLFRTGDRLRIKVIASRPGKLSLYNTNPLGVTGKDPIWSGMVTPGQETISPRMVLTGNSGADLLHVLIEPAEPAPHGTWAWLTQLLASKDVDAATGNGASKDIRLDIENTSSTSYVLNRTGQGLLSTVRIVHGR